MTSANPQTDHGSGGSDAAVPGSTGRHDEATSSPTAEHPASVLGAGPHAAGSADVRAAQRRPEILEADSRPPLARTGGGGWHLLFRPTGLGNRVRMLPGVDWRGTGGLIVVWPSLHASGQRYTWTRPLTLAAELPQVPPPLRRLLAPPVAASQPPPRGDAPIRTASAYAARALADECATVEATSPGGRNHAVNRAAFKLARLVAARALTEASATAALTDAAAAAGLGPVEAGQAIRSGLKAGQDPARNRALARQAATTRYRPGRKGGAR